MKRMSRLFCAAAAALLCSAASAADKGTSAVQGGEWIVKAGFGMGVPTIDVDLAKGYILGFSMPFKGEFVLPLKAPVGIEAEITPTWETNAYSWAFLAGANYHFGGFGLKDTDFYAGASLGFRANSVGGYGISATGTNFAFALRGGMNYFFSKNVGIFAEVGYPTVMSAGVALRFGGKK